MNATVYDPLDTAIRDTLASVTLDQILTALDQENQADSFMYFI